MYNCRNHAEYHNSPRRNNSQDMPPQAAALTKKEYQRLAKPLMEFNDDLANLGLLSLVKAGTWLLTHPTVEMTPCVVQNMPAFPKLLIWLM